MFAARQFGRHARRSFTRSASSSSSPAQTARRVVVGSTLLVGGTLFAVYYFDSRSALHRYVINPILRHTLDPETSHKVAVKVLRSGWAPRDAEKDDPVLATELWGDTLSNPIGLAAGFDKNGEAIDGLFDLGFAWVEIGSVTPTPQPGNPRPRVFHLPADQGMINRYGFPSDGASAVLSRLRERLTPSFFSSSLSPPTHASLRQNAILAVNLGKNKTSAPESIADFETGAQLFAPYADVLVVNVSSPNTPGLRGLQRAGLLSDLLAGVVSARNSAPPSDITGKRPKIVLKIAPDLSEDEIKDISEAIISSKDAIDAVIVSNTTIQRPASLSDPNKTEAGGLSGVPLRPITMKAFRVLRSNLPASVPLIACGGISTGSDALEYARAGASAVQLYTAFGYAGVGAIRRIKDELTNELRKEGTTWNEVVRKAVSERSLPATKIERKKLSEQSDGSKGESEVRYLIREALKINEQLDLLAEKVKKSGGSLPSGIVS